MVISIKSLPIAKDLPQNGHRLVNSKFPIIDLFEDVVAREDFDIMYRLQELTNPRLQAEIGNLSILPVDQIPFGIPGCSYATAPFTHINLEGSRFSGGGYGVLYVADTMKTALQEVEHHQHAYWIKVPEVKFEVFTFRGLGVTMTPSTMIDVVGVDKDDPIYDKVDYSASRAFGVQVKDKRTEAIKYASVRNENSVCWALMTPRCVTEIKQSKHFEMIWNNGAIRTQAISNVGNPHLV